MTMSVEPCTAERLLAMPRGRWRYELVAGELRRMTAAGHEHGRVAMNLSWRLAAHVAHRELGTVFTAETGFQLATELDTVRAPDVAFVTRARAEAVRGRNGYFPGAPDLAVEVISPSDPFSDVEEKVYCWLDAGSKAVGVVDPRRRFVSLYRAGQDIRPLAEGDTLDLSSVVAGFSVAVRDLFT